MAETVAVIDIGSNTIKLLVARKTGADGVETVHRNTLEARMGQGLSGRHLVFSQEVLARGAAAVASLVREAQSFSPSDIRVVATSAARDAANSDEFAEAVRQTSGLSLEILSGQREAELIGAAIQLDPGINAPDFYVFDLGGGSLECLRFSQRRLEAVVSLPLGCVRLAEKVLADPKAPFTRDDEMRLGSEIDRAIVGSGFKFSLPSGAIAVGTGGTLTTAVAITAALRNQTLEEASPSLSRNDLRELLDLIGPRPFAERLMVKGLSAGRADVFPSALATFLKLAELTGQENVYHSLLNLRYGLAAEMLAGKGAEKLAGQR